MGTKPAWTRIDAFRQGPIERPAVDKQVLVFPFTCSRCISIEWAACFPSRYTAYIQLFESLCGPTNMRPILMDPLPPARVGQKRGREVTADDNLDLGAPKKKTRLGLPATQWITVRHPLLFSPHATPVQATLQR